MSPSGNVKIHAIQFLTVLIIGLFGAMLSTAPGVCPEPMLVAQHDTLFLTDPDESCAGLSFIPTSCKPYDGHD